MRKTDQVDAPETRATELLRSGADAELQLLKQERKAERRLAAAREVLVKDEERLRRFQDRVDRSRLLVATAEDALRECQARRSTGPGPIAG